MRACVIIPTYNGAHKILNVLRALERQTLAPDEIIVVIDGSTDNTMELLRSNNFNLSNLRIIEQANGGRSQVRNRGAQEASGDLLIFLDDDMRPQPQCMEAHISHHQRHPGTILAGLQQEEITDESDELLRFKSKLSSVWNEPLHDYDKKAMPDEVAFISGANCSMPKSIWEQLGGMDERLSDAEDYDMATRAIRLHIPIYYCSQTLAWHDDLITCGSYIRRLRQYAVAQQKLQDLKPELYPATHKFAILKPKGLKAMFFMMFCYRFWIRSIDGGWWTFLPERRRFRLYDWVVTANGSFFPDRVQL